MPLSSLEPAFAPGQRVTVKFLLTSGRWEEYLGVVDARESNTAFRVWFDVSGKTRTCRAPDIIPVALAEHPLPSSVPARMRLLDEEPPSSKEEEEEDRNPDDFMCVYELASGTFRAHAKRTSHYLPT